MTEPFDGTENQLLKKELELRRKRRAKHAALQLYPIALPLALLAAMGDVLFGDALLALVEVILAFGCLVSYLGSRDLSRNRWWPAFFGLWLCCITGILRTGGTHSQLFTDSILLLFLAGVIIQSTFRIRYVTLFMILNFVMIHAISGTITLPVRDFPSWLLVMKQLVIFIGIFACVRAFILSHEKLVKEVLKQRRQLTDTRANLTHLSRLAEMGNLVATTAHEIAQPVQVISTASSLITSLVNEGGNPATVAQLSRRISESTYRISRLLTQLREFTRKDPLDIQQLDICEAVRGVKLLTDYDFRSQKVKLEFELPSDPIWVRGDSLRLQQVLINLVNNARDAAEEGADPLVRVSARIEKNWARLTVQNSGPQIALEIQQKLFTQSYFTTKSKEKGTGIGLKISSQLVEQQGGRILFSSQENDTLFVIDLPMDARPGLTSKGPSAANPGEKTGMLTS